MKYVPLYFLVVNASLLGLPRFAHLPDWMRDLLKITFFVFIALTIASYIYARISRKYDSY